MKANATCSAWTNRPPLRTKKCRCARRQRVARCAGPGLILALAVVWALPGVAQARRRTVPPTAPAGRSYFLRVNLRHDARNEIATLNVQTGERLAVGASVSVRSRSETRIEFSVAGRGDFALVLDRYAQRRLTMDELFARVFSEQDPLAPDAPIHNMTRAEQRAVADGVLTEGLSREAVLMSVGYPPPHATRSLDNKDWTYWTTRRRSYRVRFDADGKIAELRGYAPSETTESSAEEEP